MNEGVHPGPNRILLVNWRDTRHPRAGGAEIFCYETATRYARSGSAVTWFTSRPAGRPAEETIDGVRVVRRGGDLSLYFHAAKYLYQHGGSYDAIIDCQNGIPFFAPLFAPRRVAIVCIIFHVHQEQFAMYCSRTKSWLGRLLEGRASKLVYGLRPIAAISPSTRAAVRQHLQLRGEIHVVPCGHSGLAFPPPGRAPSPRIVCLGRLVSHKRVELLLHAVLNLRDRWSDLRVDIVGDGPEGPALRSLCMRLGLGDTVRFHGFVSDRQKHDLLGEAWLSVNPSVGEGWGLGVIEAAALGVPSLAFRVPGLVDSIRSGKTGWLVPEDDDLARCLHDALSEVADEGSAAMWRAQCLAWADSFSWETSAERLRALLLVEHDRLTLLRQKRADRRRRGDSAVRISFAAGPRSQLAEDLSVKLSTALRRTDVVGVADGRLHVVLLGGDERDAEAAMRRADVGEYVAEVKVARGADFLIGLRTSSGATSLALSGDRQG